MKIRSIKGFGEVGLPGSTFVIVDDLENRMGKSWVEVHNLAQQMPMRPFEVKLCMEADRALDAGSCRKLLGAAFSRAIMVVSEQKENARIYAECPANDSRRLDLLSSIGLVDDEALISMRRTMDGEIKSVGMPQGCVLICDHLADEQERAFFLQRQEKIFGRENAETWLDEICEKIGMRRMMLVHDNGLAAELGTQPLLVAMRLFSYLLQLGSKYSQISFFFMNCKSTLPFFILFFFLFVVFLSDSCSFKSYDLSLRLHFSTKKLKLWQAEKI